MNCFARDEVAAVTTTVVAPCFLAR